MHSLTKFAFAAAGLAAHQVLAFGGYGGGRSHGSDWGTGTSYSTPDNSNNNCTSTQSHGYDWSNLPPGSFNSYGGNSFSGWSCSNSFGRRDLLSKRKFQDKCITSSLDDHPSISCEDDNTMSLDTIQITSSKDADIDCVFGMPDGSTCKVTHSCSSAGSIIQNSQCGGAKSVTFRPAGGSKDTGCSIGVHSVGFNCGPPSSTPPSYTSTTRSSYSSTSSTSSMETTTSQTVPVYSKTTETTVSPSVTSTLSTESSAVATSTSSSSTETVPIYSQSTESTSTSTAIATVYDQSTTTTSSSISSAEVSPLSSSSTSPTSATVPVYSQTTINSESSTSVPGYSIPSSETSTSTSMESVPAYSQSSLSSSESSPITASIPSYSASSLFSSSESSPVTASVPRYSFSSFLNSSSTTQSVPVYGSSSTSSASSNTEASALSSSTEVTIASYSTSTIYSTSLQTTASSGTTAIITKTIAISTTICPVTATESSAVQSSIVPTYSSPPPESPNLLPKCLSTWMYLTSCKGNSDYDCFCKDEDFMNKVYGCISAWSDSDADTKSATSYLMGLCAAYIPQNPAIITGCPKDVTPAATLSYAPQSSPVSPVSTTPCTSTITLYSTIEETITSCAATVTNCPTSKKISSYAVGTTTITSQAPVYSSSDSSSSEVAPIDTSSPAPTPPISNSFPCTTITYSSTLTIPATYSSGQSQGSLIPSSTITTYIVTTVTVPQVHLTTYTVTQGTTTTVQAGLGYGTPDVTASATGLITASGSAAPPYSGGFGTTWLPSSTASSSPIIPYTGAGSKRSSGAGFLVLALGAAGFVL